MGQIAGPAISLSLSSNRQYTLPSANAPAVGCALLDFGAHGSLANTRLLDWSARPVLISPAVNGSASTDYLAYDGTWKTIPPAVTPAGSGTELQYRNGSSFGAVTNSSVSGANVNFGGGAISLSASGTIGVSASYPTLQLLSSGAGLSLFAAPGGSVYCNTSSDFIWRNFSGSTELGRISSSGNATFTGSVASNVNFNILSPGISTLNWWSWRADDGDAMVFTSLNSGKTFQVRNNGNPTFSGALSIFGSGTSYPVRLGSDASLGSWISFEIGGNTAGLALGSTDRIYPIKNNNFSDNTLYLGRSDFRFAEVHAASVWTTGVNFTNGARSGGLLFDTAGNLVFQSDVVGGGYLDVGNGGLVVRNKNTYSTIATVGPTGDATFYGGITSIGLMSGTTADGGLSLRLFNASNSGLAFYNGTSTSRPGYIAWWQNSTRLGYMGYTENHIGLNLEAGAQFQVAGGRSRFAQNVGIGTDPLSTSSFLLKIGATGNNAQIVLDAQQGVGYESGIILQNAGTNRWQIYDNGGSDGLKIYNYISGSRALGIDTSNNTTFSGRVTVDKVSWSGLENPPLRVAQAVGCGIEIAATNGAGTDASKYQFITGYNGSQLELYASNTAGGAYTNKLFEISRTGDSTFYGDVASQSAGGSFTRLEWSGLESSGSLYLDAPSGSVIVRTAAYGTAVTIANNGHATFAGNVGVSGMLFGNQQIRLNNGASYTRVAHIDGAGGWAGGYNLSMDTGSPTRDTVERVTGIHFAPQAVRIYASPTGTAGDALNPLLTLDVATQDSIFAGNISVGGGVVNGSVTANGVSSNTYSKVYTNNADAIVKLNSGLSANYRGVKLGYGASTEDWSFGYFGFLTPGDVGLYGPFGVHTFQANGNTTFAGHVTSSFQTLSADPTTSDIAASLSRLVKNSTSGTLKLWANDGGVMKSIALT